MDRQAILTALGPDSLFSGRLHLLDRVDSTNTLLRSMAEQGAPEGTAVLAEEQTAGRGTGGRTFHSPRGEGLYLSVLLRPVCHPAELLTLTGRAAAAVREAIEAACGAPCTIKWLNDIWLNGRKVCGILTELTADGGVVVGIGINLTQTAARFAEQGLEGIAASLEGEGFPVSRERLAVCVLQGLETMYAPFPHGRADCLARYRAHCLTVGRAVSFPLGGRQVTGLAVGINDDFTLAVDTDRGRYDVSAGTVTLL